MMAIQTLIIDPLREMLTQVMSVMPTIISALVVLIIGVVLSKMIRDGLNRLSKDLYIDALADKTGLSAFLVGGGIKHKLSDLLSSFVYITLIVMFLILTLEVLGVTVVNNIVEMLVTYVPDVISAVVILALGIVTAKIVASFVYAIATNINVPNSHLLERITRWAILLYVFKISLSELGYGEFFVGPIFYIGFAGVVLGLALAFGLGGKDTAACYFNKKK